MRLTATCTGTVKNFSPSFLTLYPPHTSLIVVENMRKYQRYLSSLHAACSRLKQLKKYLTSKTFVARGHNVFNKVINHHICI